ncbi:unnamed protein product [Paramecium sonneborni]|uniref:Uncharacterized protein n=1 Tax=Paramecium sonneborni TaxID=65129 RepID=A0A8S1LW12_9CILI|nr:unnamed protein product [Paramecium sonneborni]
MQALQKQPLHLLLGFQQPKHKNVIPIINMVINELQSSKTQYLTIYDQFGILEQKQYKVGQLNIKSENQKIFDDKLYDFYQSQKQLEDYFFTKQFPQQYYIPQAIIFSKKCVLLGLPFEYLKGGEIQFCDIDQFDSNKLYEQILLFMRRIYLKYAQIEQREGK